MKKINYDYLKSYSELLLLLKIKINYIGKKQVKKPKRILIINSCLVGDFIASSHAIRYFIKKNKAIVDVLVPSPIKPLAERIKGVNKVFTAKSICNRELEKSSINTNSKFPRYDFVLIMRISPDSYNILKRLQFNSVKSYLKPIIKYFFHVTKCLLLRKNFKQWKTLNFEIIEEPEKHYSLDEIFNFKKSDYDQIKNLPEIKEKGKKIIIHAGGSGWKVKFWENNKWAELLKKINKIGKFKFIFVGAGEQEKKIFEQIQSKLDFKIYSLINKIDLKELMLILKISDYFIGVDSGPRNMAHLADLPSISLLGPGPKHFMPISKRDIIIDKSNCFCTNYFCYRRKTCLQKISAEEVFNGFIKLSHKI